MSISPLGNIHFINQNAPVASAVNANTQARFDLQNAMAAELANEKNEEVAELRPAEETYKIDPEHEHERQKREQEQSSSDNDKSSQNDQSLTDENLAEIDNEIHHLDIKI